MSFDYSRFCLFNLTLAGNPPTAHDLSRLDPTFGILPQADVGRNSLSPRSVNLRELGCLCSVNLRARSASEAVAEAEYEALKNWYAAEVGQVDVGLGRVLCQRSNLYWDGTLRTRYVFLLLVALAALGLTITILG